jgi:hypothetical protein
MTNAFDDVKRVGAAVAALALLALNDLRLLQTLPRHSDPGSGQTHALTLSLFDGQSGVWASAFDVAVRWGLAGIVVAACVWAVAETVPRRQTT